MTDKNRFTVSADELEIKVDPSAVDKELGSNAAKQAALGANPPSWAVDEDTWERAKEAADQGSPDDYYALVTHIYRQMGGTVG